MKNLICYTIFLSVLNSCSFTNHCHENELREAIQLYLEEQEAKEALQQDHLAEEEIELPKQNLRRYKRATTKCKCQCCDGKDEDGVEEGGAIENSDELLAEEEAIKKVPRQSKTG